MQDNINDYATNFSRANATQLKSESSALSSMNPPGLFSEKTVQEKSSEKESGEINDSQNTQSLEIENNVQQVHQTKLESEGAEETEEKMEIEGSLSIAQGEENPPSEINRSAGNNQISSPITQNKENSYTDFSTNDHSSAHSGSVMQKMEASFGADFSNVSINTNSSAAKDAGALAFTQGNQIDFAPGTYKPDTKQGQELLGHELTHVIQQRENRVKPTGEVNGKPLNDDPALEKEADIKGEYAAQTEPKGPFNQVVNSSPPIQKVATQFRLGNSSSTIQRKEEVEDTTPVQVDEVAIATEMIDQGAKNENYISDEVFYARYPGIKRRKLIFPNNSDAETELINDWLRIRNKVVRPILQGKEIPEGKKPRKGKPKKRKPGKEKPEDKKPQKDKPKKGKPQKDKPGKEPDKEQPIEIPDGWTYDDYFNLLKALAEFGRLSTITVIGAPVGLASGQGAAFLNLVQDLIHSVGQKDLILGITTLARNITVHQNNFISDTSFAISWLQDIVTGIGALATLITGGAASPFVVSFTAFTASINSVLSLLNVIGDGSVMFFDALVIWHLNTVYENLPEDDPEKDAYKELLDGYKINFLFDSLGFVLDLVDVVSGGFAHGEFAEKGIKVAAKVLKLTHFGSGLLLTIANAIWGTGANETLEAHSGVVQKKEDEEKGEKSNVDIAIEYLGSFVQGNGLVESGIDYFGGVWIDNMDKMEESLNNLQNDEEATVEFFQKINETIAGLESKVLAVDNILEVTNGVKENGQYILGQIESVEAIINGLQVPDVEFPEIDIADNVLVDMLEDVANATVEGIEDQFNQLIAELNEKLVEFKEMVLTGTTFVKEQVISVIEQVESFESTMNSFQSFLIEHIAEVKEMVAQAGNPKALIDAVIKEIMKTMGIEGDLNVEEVIKGFHEFKRKSIEMLERLKGEKESEGNPVQQKPEKDGHNEKSEIEEVQNGNSKQPFQMKTVQNSNNDKNNISEEPFALKENSLGDNKYEGSGLMPFALRKEIEI